MIKRDPFGREFDDGMPRITLHNGRVFQTFIYVPVPVTDPEGTPVMVQATDAGGGLLTDAAGKPVMVQATMSVMATDGAATSKAQQDWLFAHPEEVYDPSPLALVDLQGNPIPVQDVMSYNGFELVFDSSKGG